MEETNLDIQLNEEIALFSQRVDKVVAEFKKEDTLPAVFPTTIFTKYLPALQPVAVALSEKYSFLLSKPELEQFKASIQEKIEKGMEALSVKF